MLFATREFSGVYFRNGSMGRFANVDLRNISLKKAYGVSILEIPRTNPDK